MKPSPAGSQTWDIYVSLELIVLKLAQISFFWKLGMNLITVSSLIWRMKVIKEMTGCDGCFHGVEIDAE